MGADDPLHLSNSNSMTMSRLDATSPMSTLSNLNSTTNNMIGSYILPNSRSSNSNTIRNGANDDLSRSYDASDSNYLEPIITAHVNRLARFNSMNNGIASTHSMEPLSPGSPNSFNNILEVTTLNPLPSTGLNNNNGVSNVYQEFLLHSSKDMTMAREICMKKLSLDIPPQEYAPTANAQRFSSPTAVAAVSFQSHMISSNANLSNENLSHSQPISPTQMTDAADAIPTYVNITPGEISSAASTPKVPFNDYKQTQQLCRNNVNNNNYLVDSMHCYENLEPSEVRPILMRNQMRRLSRTEILAKTDAGIINSPATNINENISEPSTPNTGVNYIVLDLDQSHSQSSATHGCVNTNTEIIQQSIFSSCSSPIRNPISTIVSSSTISPSMSASTTMHSVSSLLLPDSPQRKAFEYVTIDFNKTNALSNSIVTNTECEGARKTRHSSNNPPNVINTPHSNSVSD